MRMIANPGMAWACLALGAALLTGVLFFLLKRDGKLRPGNTWSLLLPAALGIGAARGGFELLQLGESYEVFGWTFRWCYTCGFTGLAAGCALSSRICGADRGKILDGCSAWLCLGMALARLCQRWLGETGMGPIQDQAGIFSMLNDWDEPVLATWMIECLVCLAAAAGTALMGRRNPRARGGTFCSAVFLMMIPQILVEQFRSGAYLRFMMMRLEQVLYGAWILGALCWLLHRAGGKAPGGWKYLAALVALMGGVALIQFILDGKIVTVPQNVGWAGYGVMILGMMGVCLGALRRTDRLAAAAS